MIKKDFNSDRDGRILDFSPRPLGGYKRSYEHRHLQISARWRISLRVIFILRGISRAEFVQLDRAKSGIVRPIFFRLQRSRSNSLSEGQVVFFPFGYPNETTKRSCREHGRACCWEQRKRNWRRHNTGSRSAPSIR